MLFAYFGWWHRQVWGAVLFLFANSWEMAPMWMLKTRLVDSMVACLVTCSYKIDLCECFGRYLVEYACKLFFPAWHCSLFPYYVVANAYNRHLDGWNASVFRITRRQARDCGLAVAERCVQAFVILWESFSTFVFLLMYSLDLLICLHDRLDLTRYCGNNQSLSLWSPH